MDDTAAHDGERSNAFHIISGQEDMLFDQRLLRRFQAIIGYALKNLQKQGRTLLLPILLPRQSDDDLSSYISFLFYFLVLVEKRLII